MRVTSKKQRGEEEASEGRGREGPLCGRQENEEKERSCALHFYSRVAFFNSHVKKKQNCDKVDHFFLCE